MSSDWQRVEIGQLAKLRSGFPFKSADWKDSGVPVIKIANVKGGRIIPDGCGFVSTEVASKSAEWFTRTGDVLIAMTGYVGEVAQVKPGERYLINQRVGRFHFTPNAEVEPTYFFYHLQNSDTRAEIEGVARGSAQPNLSAGDAHKIKITLPPLAIQREIAAILGALDDRITLLRETNATLEAIAQALFKSWFVDFDPVRAKMEGRAPEGMDEATAALFPDSFEETELGAVPRGWKVCSFTDAVHVIGGGTPKTSVAEYWGGEIPWFSVVDAPNGTDTYVIDTEKHITEAGLNNCSTKLLPAGTTIISARGTVGRLALVGREMAMNQSCYGLRGKAGDAYFTYFSTCRLVDGLKQRSHGSVFDTITRDTLASVSVIYPGTPTITAFDNLVAPVMDRIRQNLEQAQTLATLRDTLLPRLISGQLRLPVAQDELEAA